VKKQKLVEWQEVKEITSKSFDSDLNTAGSLAMQMNILAKEVLTPQQYAVFDLVGNKGVSFRKIKERLNISEPRISELWHLASDKVETAWRERNSNAKKD